MTTELQSYQIPRLAWSLPELQVALGVSRSTLYKLIGSGQLTTVKVAGRTLVVEDEVQRYIQSVRAESRTISEVTAK